MISSTTFNTIRWQSLETLSNNCIRKYIHNYSITLVLLHTHHGRWFISPMLLRIHRGWWFISPMAYDIQRYSIMIVCCILIGTSCWQLHTHRQPSTRNFFIPRAAMHQMSFPTSMEIQTSLLGKWWFEELHHRWSNHRQMDLMSLSFSHRSTLASNIWTVVIKDPSGDTKW